MQWHFIVKIGLINSYLNLDNTTTRFIEYNNLDSITILTPHIRGSYKANMRDSAYLSCNN